MKDSGTDVATSNQKSDSDDVYLQANSELIKTTNSDNHTDNVTNTDTIAIATSKFAVFYCWRFTVRVCLSEHSFVTSSKAQRPS